MSPTGAVFDYPYLDQEPFDAAGVAAYIITASVIVGVLPAASRLTGINRDSSVIIGELVAASRSVGMARTASLVIGELVAASRLLALTRSASVIIGEAVSASRTVGAVRSASVVIGLVVTASRLINYLRQAAVVVGVFLGGGWVSPTSHNDPDSAWTNETNAYDENTSTSADCPISGAGVWGSYLELNVPSIPCDRFRFNAYYSMMTINYINVQLYYDGGWVNVLNTSYVDNTWETETIPAGEKAVTAARIRFNNFTGGADTAKLYEFDFYQVSGVSRVLAAIRAALVEIGEAVSASGAANFSRTSAVIIGVAVAATRTYTRQRSAAVVVGLAVTAVRVWHYVRNPRLGVDRLTQARHEVSRVVQSRLGRKRL